MAKLTPTARTKTICSGAGSAYFNNNANCEISEHLLLACCNCHHLVIQKPCRSSSIRYTGIQQQMTIEVYGQDLEFFPIKCCITDIKYHISFIEAYYDNSNIETHPPGDRHSCHSIKFAGFDFHTGGIKKIGADRWGTEAVQKLSSTCNHLQSIAVHRDHFARCLSVCPSIW